jgi:UDP-GlcNAc3NAcA epimerase
MLEAVERVLEETRSDALLVYGDTNSTLAGALAAAKMHVPVAHVEAGLRSFNRRMPEEINRVVTDHLAHWLFAPTEAAVAHLQSEGIAAASVHLVGDVMYDAALHFAARARAALLDDGKLKPKEYILATIHRAENTDDLVRLRAMFDALVVCASSLPVVLPLHPRTRGVLDRHGLLGNYARRLLLVDPVGYLEMLALEKDARLIVTDSGGVQKEAYFCRVPCVTLRDETEWTELVDTGWNTLIAVTDAGATSRRILDTLSKSPPSRDTVDLYGGGTAARHIAAILCG